ncbi:hypothetical protein, partial [Coleofasciculus chthonoplastes]|uniref:hypothetical protein n=1 Tax=Coleofasciculus chthonoplastes TaxID=64178 RepID=UPI0032FF4FE2
MKVAKKTVLISKDFAFIVVYFLKMKTPCYKRGDDKGCFAFFAWGRIKDVSLFLYRRGEKEGTCNRKRSPIIGMIKYFF